MILDALRELLRQGNITPTAEDVAEHAGVSTRSVFRIFDSIEGLLLALDMTEHAAGARAFRACPLDAPIDERARSFLGNCARLYETVGPIRQALERYESVSKDLQFYRERQHRVVCKKIERVFATELDGLTRAERIQKIGECSALSSWSFWNELRTSQRMTARAARTFLERQLVEAFRSTIPLPEQI